MLLKCAGSSRFRDPGCTVYALKRTVLEETPTYGEQHGFLPLLAANVGFKVVEIDLLSMRQYRVREIIERGAEMPRKKPAHLTPVGVAE